VYFPLLPLESIPGLCTPYKKPSTKVFLCCRTRLHRMLCHKEDGLSWRGLITSLGEGKARSFNKSAFLCLPDSISIGSAVFAQLTAECRYIYNRPPLFVRCHVSYAWQRSMYLLKIAFSRINLANLTHQDKILQVYVGRIQISHVKMWTPWAKGARNGGEKVHVLDHWCHQLWRTGASLRAPLCRCLSKHLFTVLFRVIYIQQVIFM